MSSPSQLLLTHGNIAASAEVAQSLTKTRCILLHCMLLYRAPCVGYRLIIYLFLTVAAYPIYSFAYI